MRYASVISDAVTVALIAATPPTIMALWAVVLGWLNRTKLADVGEKVDGRLTELLELTRTSSHAGGVKEEREKTDMAVGHRERAKGEG